MNNEQKNLILAVGLSAFFLFIWQTYFSPQPQTTSKQVVTKEVSKIEGSLSQTNTSPTVENSNDSQQVEKNIDASQLYSLGNNEQSIEISGNLDLTKISNQDSIFNFTDILGRERPFELWRKTSNGFEKIPFRVSEENGVLKGVNEQQEIQFTISPDENSYKVFLTSSQPQQLRLVLKSTSKTAGQGRERKFLYFSKDVKRETVGEDETIDDKIKWFGVDFNYHLFAVIFDNPEAVLAKLKPGEEKKMGDETVTYGSLIVDLVNAKQSFSFNLVFTNKEYDKLMGLGSNLALSVDYGMFGVISVPILRALQFFYKYVKNYGVAIILLTLVIRLFTFPLQYKSFKSMKKMQVIQPDLTKIREKFKDDPQRMQKESMELFKKSGVNPLSGCLPLVLQMPIFFAFYSVLRESIELVNAPFLLWIHDLSSKDPYYVLPVLLTFAMFAHQKLTPTPSADPNQKKIMMFMPLIFGLFMLNLPAGLSLYILVSTIFGMLQQLFVYRQVS